MRNSMKQTSQRSLLFRQIDGRTLVGEVFVPLEFAGAFADWKLDYETLTWNDGDIDISADYVLNHSKPLV